MFMLDGAGVAAFDTKTGKRRWPADDFSAITAGLAVVGHAVVAGGRLFTRNGPVVRTFAP